LYRDPVDGSHVYTLYETGRRYRITRLSGGLVEVTGAQELGPATRSLTLGGDGQPWEIAIEEFETARAPYQADQPFDLVVTQAHAAFVSFVDAVATARRPLRGPPGPTNCGPR